MAFIVLYCVFFLDSTTKVLLDFTVRIPMGLSEHVFSPACGGRIPRNNNHGTITRAPL